MHRWNHRRDHGTDIRRESEYSGVLRRRFPTCHGQRTTTILDFDESFIGGFLGFARTYGAVVRIEADTVETLEADWPDVLRHTAEWRAVRQEKALSLHLYFIVPKALAWDAMAFVARKLLRSASDLPEEFVSLRLEPVVFANPGMQVYLGITLNSEATARSNVAR